MENTSKNESTEAAGRGGVAAKLLSAAAAAAAGTGALVATVNQQIKSNLSKYAKDGLAALGRFEKEYQSLPDSEIDRQAIETDRFAARRQFESAMETASNDVISFRGKNPNKLSKALREARNKYRIDTSQDEHLIYQAEASSLLPEQMVAERQKLAGIIVRDEENVVSGMLKDAVSHVPLKDKILLSSELHLTGSQKTLAVVFAAGTAAVTAGAIHYLLQQHAQHKALRGSSQPNLDF
jgi:hypothetical protein